MSSLKRKTEFHLEMTKLFLTALLGVGVGWYNVHSDDELKEVKKLVEGMDYGFWVVFGIFVYFLISTFVYHKKNK